jgi:hypothetical protein
MRSGLANCSVCSCRARSWRACHVFRRSRGEISRAAAFPTIRQLAGDDCGLTRVAVMAEVKTCFRPGFINRIDKGVVASLNYLRLRN